MTKNEQTKIIGNFRLNKLKKGPDDVDDDEFGPLHVSVILFLSRETTKGY